ncbi:MAG: [Fe-Fe] hydrogenase large subunit C-terminal domain-containing protein [Bacillota bacterium]
MTFIERTPAKCKDCYKCLRECPVKAIQVVREGQSPEMHVKIIEDRCILDGKCISVCPQNAKLPRSDVKAVKMMFSRGYKVAATVAPSFAGLLPLDDPLKMPSILRRLGFSTVSETAYGAELVAKAQRKLFDEGKGPFITSPCPAVVNLVEKHYPESIPYLSPLVSPAVAHSRYLKSIDPDIKVVFIGPCVAKKEECTRPDAALSFDVALTFRELWSWVEEEGIDLESLPVTDFDPPYPNLGRLFPTEGGILKAAGIEDGVVSPRTVMASGIENCVEVIDYLTTGTATVDIVDLMACEGGCLGGPGSANNLNVFARRQKLIKYWESQMNRREATDSSELINLADAKLYRNYRNRKPKEVEVPEAEIQSILAMTGKYSKDDELNCGACGYQSCRDKAIACYRGLADPVMCIPYMRQRAESMANLIVSAIPSAIFVVSSEGQVLDVNRLGQILTQEPLHELLGQPIDLIMPAEVCSRIRQVEHDEDVYRGLVELEGQWFDVTIFSEPTQRSKVIILTDRTQEIRDRERLSQLRDETLARVEQVIRKQMEVAQKVAGLLGETTAETKGSLSQLVKIMKNEAVETGRGENGGPED